MEVKNNNNINNGRHQLMYLIQNTITVCVRLEFTGYIYIYKIIVFRVL